MELKRLIEDVKKINEIKEILRDGGFLTSVLSVLNPDEKIKEWYIGFYNPKTKKITEVYVLGGSMKVESPDEPLREINHRLDESNINVEPMEAMDIAKKELKRYRIKPKKIIISFQKKEKEVWCITFIGGIGNLVTVDVDVKNGKVIKSEETNLLKGVSRHFAG